MKTIRQVVDAHHQKYLNSCSPSLMEILLKIHEKVDQDFYNLQHLYKNKNVGLTDFRNQEIEGLRIHCHDDSNGQSFLSRLMELNEAGEVIALYCRNRHNKNFHGWIVESVDANEIHLISKFSENGSGEGKFTATERFPISGPGAIEISDLVYGKPVEPKREPVAGGDFTR